MSALLGETRKVDVVEHLSCDVDGSAKAFSGAIIRIGVIGCTIFFRNSKRTTKMHADHLFGASRHRCLCEMEEHVGIA